ncbi:MULTISPECIES: imidazole glycerol phosphate synthase subunit HisH [unclassified Butyrivibrio]|uniref:imidazole glycerol phosphate synthase subunit HisH n=1 Tax=unclassified Butyrivibrio TaxID=2639466 RepID=UPI000421778B|nr:MULTISPECIES: imidazole glycerol phosphate synthase subunit HisH [unclassified Butyrivibrio]SDB49263.1 glutamine amidotransferase [Butyrivibrio sp. INlla16]SEK49291.1 glutamine amidotransferase [Butyrivibrio sp. ob235]
MLAVIDYDAGNIKSVENAFKYLGTDICVTRDPGEIMRADRVILPGVGAFGDAMKKLNEYNLTDVIRTVAGSGTPFMGICLGLQLLFDSSEESEGVSGLSILPGKIRRIPDNNGLKVPQIGWNNLKYPNKGKLFEGIDEDSYVYFVHSYYLDAADKSIVTATTEYGVTVDASVEKGNVFACQFHPEKSAEVGMEILRNFLKV